MSSIPADLKYTATHEWIRDNGDGSITIGITDFAQEKLGDIVYVDLPDPEIQVVHDDPVGVIESVKVASDIYAPLSGSVVAVNTTLLESPEVVNTDPYGEGWMLTIAPSAGTPLRELLDAAGYAATLPEGA